MIRRLTLDEVESIRATEKPAESAVRTQDLAPLRARIAALDSVLDGASLSDATQRWGVPTSTLARLIRNALSSDETHKRIGYRACIPHARHSGAARAIPVVPERPHSFAMDAVLEALPELRHLVIAFTGALPSRTKRSAAFSRLHSQVLKVLTSKGYQGMYPLNTQDQGRRALMSFIMRLRVRRGAEHSEVLPDDPCATRIEHLFPIRPLDRVEYDEHSVDIDAWIAMPMADGSIRMERISRIWLLAVIDVGSGAVLGWSLVTGRKYDRHDVLSLFANIMAPWTPRDLSGHDLRYSPNAWMPSSYLVDNTVMRGSMVAMDNDSSHLAKMTVDNLMDYHMGILHFGRSGMGEGRPYIEALFKRIENSLLRYVAGGFVPATDENDRQVTTSLQGENYPVLLEVLEDLIDTHITTHNVTSRSTREPRSPKRLVDEYLATGAWVWHAPCTEDHVRQMTVMRTRVTIRGSMRNGVPPVVYLDHARYRSPKLAGQWQLIGRTFDATYEDWKDVRKLTLWHDNKRVVTLHALAPYADAPHTLSTRRRAARWANHPDARESSDVMSGDNVLAYHAAVRRAASGIKDAGAKLATGEVPASVPASSPPGNAEPPLKGLGRRASGMRLR